MAKPIKKGKSRFTSGVSGKQIGGVIVGILIFAAIIFAIYWLYHNGSLSSDVSKSKSVSSIQKFIEENGLKSTGILVLAIGGLLFAFIFNKK